MPHTIALRDGQIRIVAETGITQDFAQTAEAAEHLARTVIASGCNAVARDASLDDPAAHRRPGFRYNRFITQVRERVVML